MIRFRFVAWLFACILIFLGAQIAQQKWVNLLMLFALFLPLISLVYLWRMRRVIKVDLQALDSQVLLGEDARWSLVINNYHWTRTVFARIEADASSVSHHRFVVRKVFLLNRHAKSNFTLAIPSEHCGHLKPANIKLYISDIFGFFQLLIYQANENDLPEVYVLPPYGKVLQSEFQQKLAVGELPPGKSKTLLDELDRYREFRPGDALKLINWKLSAKHQQHVVREFEKADEHTAHLMVHLPEITATIPSNPQMADHLSVRDEMMMYLLAEADQILSHGIKIVSHLFLPAPIHSELNLSSDVALLQQQLAMLPYKNQLPLDMQLAQIQRDTRSLFLIVLSSLSAEVVEQLHLLNNGAMGVHVVWFPLTTNTSEEQEQQLLAEKLNEYGILVQRA